MSDFSRGVVTLDGMIYFAAILVVMLYVSMALIGRRHWFSGRAAMGDWSDITSLRTRPWCWPRWQWWSCFATTTRVTT